LSTRRLSRCPSSLMAESNSLDSCGQSGFAPSSNRSVAIIMEVRGLRNSWDIVETNWVLSLSTRL